MEIQYRLVTKGREIEFKLNLNRLISLIVLMQIDPSLIVQYLAPFFS